MTEARLDTRIAGGVLWSHAAQAVGLLIVFAGLTALARVLTPHDFGLFAMAMTAVTFFEVMRDFGLRPALLYFGRDDGAEPVFDTGFVLAVGVGMALTTVLLLLAPLAGVFYDSPEVTTLMEALSVYFLIAGIGEVFDIVLRWRLDFRRRFWPEAGAPFARYSTAIILALQGYGVWSLVGGQLVGIALAVSLSVLLSGWRPGLRFRSATARKLLGYGWKMSAVQLLSGVILNLDYVLVGRFLGSSELGVYTLAFKLPDMAIVAMAYAFSNLLLPAYARVGDDPAKFRVSFLHALHYLTLTLGPVAAGLAVLAPLLVPWLFGDQWAAAIPVLQLLAIASFFRGVVFSAGAAFLAAGRPDLLLLAQAIWATVLSGGFYAAAQVDIIAVAAIQIPAVLIDVGVKFALACRLLALDWRDLLRTILPPSLAIVPMVLALVALLNLLAGLPPGFVVMAGVAIGATVYGLAVYILDPSAVQHARGLATSMLGRR